MTFFTGTGRHRAQIIYFLWIQIGSPTSSGIGLRSGGPLRRMRRFSGLSIELWIENFGKSWSRAIERKGPCLYVCTDGSRRACGVGACARLVATLGAPRETSGPRIDRIPPTRPPWWRRQYRELKKLIFSAPSKCPIDLFGPVANGRILKRLHGVPAFASALPAASSDCGRRSRLATIVARLSNDWLCYGSLPI